MGSIFYKSQKAQLVHAYNTLFRPNDGYTYENLINLTVQSLKKAYRSRLFQNHPDRAKILGIDEALLAKKTIEITDCYNRLSSYISGKSHVQARYHYTSYTWKRESPAGPGPHPGGYNENFFRNFRKWDIPNVELKLGRFLYYLRIITFKTLIDAVSWQIQHRPYFGDIARTLNILTLVDTTKIYRERKKGERFGECAVRIGLITPGQRDLILGEQKKREPKIGRYFIEHDILSPGDLETLLLKLRDHNKRVAGKTRHRT